MHVSSGFMRREHATWQLELSRQKTRRVAVHQVPRKSPWERPVSGDRGINEEQAWPFRVLPIASFSVGELWQKAKWSPFEVNHSGHVHRSGS